MPRILPFVLSLGWLVFTGVVNAEDAAPKRETITNSIGMKLVLIPAGDFLMGSPDNEAKREDDEGPQHRVRITKPFYLGVYEVTQAEYERVMNENPSHFKNVAGLDTKRFPVETISWNDAMKFCSNLSAMPGETAAGRVYELPTEAQWEYACRAGTTTPFHFGSVLNGDQANCNGTYPYGNTRKGKYLERPTTVGSYTPNAWGLYDMHGNVWEWCSDWYNYDYYGQPVSDDPKGPADSWNRVLRGGSWWNSTKNSRSANRYRYLPDAPSFNDGFRVAMSPADK